MKHYLLKTLLFSMLFIFMTSHIVHASDEEADKPDEYRTEEAQEVFNPEDIVESQIDTLHLDELKGFWEDITNEYGGFLPESQKGSIYDFIKGEKEFSFDQWALGILKFVFHEFVVNGKLLGTLILLAVFSMFLQSLQNAFESGTVSKVAYAIVLMVLVILALNSFHIAMEYASDTVHKMTSFILALIPLLLALIASSGGLISAAFFIQLFSS